MNEKKMIEEKIKEYFKELVSDECFYTWSDTFDVELVGERRVVVSYHGHQKFKKFKKRCKRMLKKAVRMACGKRRKVKCRKRRKTEQNGQLRKNVKAVKFFVVGMIFLCIATAVMIVMFNYIGNRKFRETFYSVSSLKVDSTVRVIQLSDLHSCSYGEDNEKLLERVKALEPDVIICTGDMVDSAKEDLKDAIQIGKALAEIAPSYYVYGNNEVETIYDFSLNRIDLDQKFGFDDDNRDETALLSIEDSFEEELEKVGIKVLKNEKDTIEIENMKVDVYGVLTSNPSSFWPYSEKSFSEYLYENPDHIKITAVHEPFIFEELQEEYWGDLMICGHTHGGVMRVPVLGPLYTTEGGLFPERKDSFVYGRYDVAGKPLIVSGGLENLDIVRVNNQPELVVIDINKF